MRVLVFCPFSAIYSLTVQGIFDMETVGPTDYLFSVDNPSDDKRANVRAAYQRGQLACLQGDYDAMMTVEADNIIPEDALQRLSAVDAGVAYGLYAWRHGSRDWTAYTEFTEDGTPTRSVCRTPALAREWWGTVRDVSGWGFGCTLIHSWVLELLDWTQEVPPDKAMAQFCNLNAVPQKCDLGLVVGHILHDEPLVLWPDPDAPDLVRFEALC